MGLWGKETAVWVRYGWDVFLGRDRLREGPCKDMRDGSLQPGLILPRRLWCHTHLAGVEKLLECWAHPQFSLSFNPNAQQHPELEEKEEITF